MDLANLRILKSFIIDNFSIAVLTLSLIPFYSNLFFWFLVGKPVPSTASLADSSSKDGTIGLAIAFAASTIFAIVFFIIYVQFKRKHQ